MKLKGYYFMLRIFFIVFLLFNLRICCAIKVQRATASTASFRHSGINL